MMTAEEKRPYLVMATVDELAAFAKKSGIESYRAGQIERWVSKRWTVDPDAMTDLSQSARKLLPEHFLCNTVKENFCSNSATANSSNAP